MFPVEMSSGPAIDALIGWDTGEDASTLTFECFTMVNLGRVALISTSASMPDEIQYYLANHDTLHLKHEASREE
jgi:hypothetical protein